MNGNIDCFKITSKEALSNNKHKFDWLIQKTIFDLGLLCSISSPDRYLLWGYILDILCRQICKPHPMEVREI
jgi:hypothetical protein